MFVQRLKLRPPHVQPSWLPRTNLELRLGEGIRVLSIVGGPGYGKTVLASLIFNASSEPRLWYSLDGGDADLAVFAMHLDAMTRSIGGLQSFGAESWRLGAPKDVGSLFAETIAPVSGNLLVVFDDVHVLRESRSLQALEELVERGARTGATFVLCGRSMPVSLHSFAASAQLASVAPAELAFDPSEARTYLEGVMRRRPGSQEITELIRRAEGWPAGLALIASTVTPLDRKGSAQPQTSSADARQLLFDYLAAEIVADLSEGERNFLLRTSIFERLEVDFCNAVLERTDSSEMLASLARRSLFIAHSSDGDYTCHQLFREFLLHTLERTSPRAALQALRRRAAEQLADRGDLVGAIAQRLDAGDLDEAADALDACALSLLRVGLVAAVERLLARIDGERIASRPSLVMARGRALRERGDWDAALATLERAILGARRSGAFDVIAEAVRLSASILASRGEFTRLRSMLDDALALGERLPEESTTTLRMTLAAVCIETERFDDALTIFREVTPSVIARADEAAQGSVLHNTAVAHLRRGDLYAGLALYERALKLKQNSGQRVSSLLTLGDLVYIRVLLGDADEAEQLCEKLLLAAHDYGSHAAIAHAHENQGSLRLMKGDVIGAEQAFREAQGMCDPGDVLVLPDIQHGLARCALARLAVEEADELSAAAIAGFRSVGKFQQLAPILLTRADAQMRRGDVVAAYGAACDAVDAAAKGADAVLQTTTCLDAAALLVRLAPRLQPSERSIADGRAAQAATTAIALLHQRDYRFLLRTQAATFRALRDDLRRWNVGGGLFPDEGASLRRHHLRIEMLGGFNVFVDGEPLGQDVWKRRKARDILAYLIGMRGRAVPRARLADLYWPDPDADSANDRLRVTISAIRKAVGDVVKFEGDGYRFAPPPGTVIDRDLFDDQIERGRESSARGEADAARASYQSAVDLYRGDFLDGMDDGAWQWHERERLRAACLEALRALTLDPRPDVSRLALERILQVAPFDLDAVRLRLDRLVAEMRMAEARRDYAEWRARYRAAVGDDAPEIWEPFATPV